MRDKRILSETNRIKRIKVTTEQVNSKVLSHIQTHRNIAKLKLNESNTFENKTHKSDNGGQRVKMLKCKFAVC